jgi:hypothetical protein
VQWADGDCPGTLLSLPSPIGFKILRKPVMLDVPPIRWSRRRCALLVDGKGLDRIVRGAYVRSSFKTAAHRSTVPLAYSLYPILVVMCPFARERAHVNRTSSGANGTGHSWYSREGEPRLPTGQTKCIIFRPTYASISHRAKRTTNMAHVGISIQREDGSETNLFSSGDLSGFDPWRGHCFREWAKERLDLLSC